MTYSFYISTEDKVDTIKKIFTDSKGVLNPVVSFGKKDEKFTELILTDPLSSDLATLFYSGVICGINDAYKTINK